MKLAFTHLEITRLAYNETSTNPNAACEEAFIKREYTLLKSMQKKVDSSLSEPSQNSVDAILSALKSL